MVIENMPADPNISAPRTFGWWSVSMQMIGYMLLTAGAIHFLEPGLTPPGFTGNGAYAMGIIFLGAFHVAGKLRCSWAFLLFGGLGAALLLPEYFGDNRFGLGIHAGYTTIKSSIIGWTVFVVTVALMTRMVAKTRWRLIQELPRENPLCKHCGYDLRASQATCPECGHAFDLRDATTYVATIRHWDLRWLARRAVMVVLLVALPLAAVYGALYCWSQQPAIAAVERLGGSVGTKSDLPTELQHLPAPLRLLALDKLFDHAESVVWRGKPIQDRQLMCLKGMPQLNEIHIDNAPITGIGFAPLATLPYLELLYLPGSAVNDEGLASIAGLRHLKQLQLSGTAITDAGLDHLTPLQALEDLWLEQTAISDAGLMKLVELPKLRYLGLTKTSVTAEGIRRFKRLRPNVYIEGP